MPPAVAVALTVVSAVASAAQSYMQGQAQSASYNNQAKAAYANAQIAAQNASIEKSQGRLELANKSAEWQKALGRQRAAMAQGGVLESPTGLLVRAEAEQRAKDEEFAVQFDSQRRQAGYNFEAQDLTSQANVAVGNAGQARLGGLIGGVGSLAGGLSNAYGMGKKF